MPGRALHKGKGKAVEDDATSLNGSEASRQSSDRENHNTKEDAASSDEDILGDTRLPEEQRRMRKRLRANVNAIAELKTDASNVTFEQMSGQTKQIDSLFRDIKTPGEAAIDAQALGHLADILQVKTRNLRFDKSAFDVHDWLGKVNLYLAPDRGDAGASDDEDERGTRDTEAQRHSGWMQIGKIAVRHSLRCPAIDFMFGPLEVERKQRQVKEGAQARRMNRSMPPERVEPRALNNQDIERDMLETSMVVQQLNKILNEKGGETGMNFFRFIINPESYGQTIENLFYMAFLIKEGKCFIDTDVADGPIIMSVEPMTEEDRASAKANGEDASKRQVVVELTEATWREAIDLYDITDSTIPTRTREARNDAVSDFIDSYRTEQRFTCRQNKWYT